MGKQTIYIVIYATTSSDLDVTVDNDRTKVFNNLDKAKEYFDEMKLFINNVVSDTEEIYDILSNMENEYTVVNAETEDDGMTVRLLYKEI